MEYINGSNWNINYFIWKIYKKSLKMGARGGCGGFGGRPGSHFDPQGRPDAKKTDNSGSLAALGPPFWSTFGTLFGTWSSHIAFFVVFLRACFEARFFIEFRWPDGSKIGAF